MDRRSYERKHVQHSVTLQSPRSRPVWTQMRDLSLGGMFVETGPAGPSQNSTVKVTFEMPNGGQPEGFTLEAVVVRRGQDGSGLMFVRMDHEVIRNLSQALSRFSSAGSAMADPSTTA